MSEGSAALLPGWRGRRRDGGSGNTPVCFRKMIFSGKRRFGFVSVHSGVLGGERNPVARVSLPSSHSEESRRLSSSVSMKILNGRDASWVRAEPDLSTPPLPAWYSEMSRFVHLHRQRRPQATASGGTLPREMGTESACFPLDITHTHRPPPRRSLGEGGDGLGIESGL